MCFTNVPNYLTILRIALIPLFVIGFYWPSPWRYPLATLIFAFAAFTDWLDGYLARKLKQASPVGAFLDPVADKLIVVVALVLLTATHNNALIAILTAIIVCREITVSALREWMAELGQRAMVAVSWIGKIKTAIQMLAVLLLLAQPPQPGNLVIILGYIALVIATGLTLWSMCQYLSVAWKQIKN